jgi:type IV secretory pathway TraG/TraD family ATPase VirD4
MLRLKAKHLPSHTAIFGDTGGGKTLFMLDYLREVERRGEIAIIWDPDRQFASKFRNVDRGDWILDPTCSEVPYWDIRREYRDEGEAHALSTCFFPDNPTVKDPFWNTSARGLFTALNAMHHPTTAELTLWMAQDDPLIDERVAGTEYARILTNNAPGMRSSIIAHLNQIAQPLRMMPTHPDGHRTFSVRDWCETRNSWIFITASPSYSAILNPLHTFFVSSLVQRLVAMGPAPRSAKGSWVIFDRRQLHRSMVQELHMAPHPAP